MNCAPEGQHYQAARNLQTQRWEVREDSAPTPSLMDCIFEIVKQAAAAVFHFLRLGSRKRKAINKRTSSLRFF